MKYQKLPTNVEDQITILKSRKLDIPDVARAEKYLKTIGYYRLTGYMYHLQKSDGSHNFKDNISFDNIIDTYNFDKKLRFLTLSYLERIEVAMRALITYNYSISKGFFWYTDYENFVKPPPIPNDIKEKIEKGQSLPRKYINAHDYVLKSIKESFANSSDLFATKFKLKYTSESLPPCNIALELVSMGCISRLYEALTNCNEKQAIAGVFGLPNNVLSSYPYCLSRKSLSVHLCNLPPRQIDFQSAMNCIERV